MWRKLACKAEGTSPASRMEKNVFTNFATRSREEKAVSFVIVIWELRISMTSNSQSNLNA